MEKFKWFYKTDAEIPADQRKYYTRGKAKVNGEEVDGYVLVVEEGFDAYLNPGLATNRDTVLSEKKKIETSAANAQAEVTRLNTEVIPALNERVRTAEQTATNAVKPGHVVVTQAEVDELKKRREAGTVEEIALRASSLAAFEAIGTLDEIKTFKTKAHAAEVQSIEQKRTEQLTRAAKAVGYDGTVLTTLLNDPSRGLHENGKKLTDLIKNRLVDLQDGTGKKVLRPFIVTITGEGEAAEESAIPLDEYAAEREDWEPFMLSLIAGSEGITREDSETGRRSASSEKGETHIVPTGRSGGAARKPGGLVDDFIAKEQKQRDDAKAPF